MATLQVRGLDDKLYTELKRLAKDENRSLNQEVIVLLKKSIAPAQSRISPREATRELLKLRWEDNRSAAEIIQDIESNRKNKKILRNFSNVFD